MTAYLKDLEYMQHVGHLIDTARVQRLGEITHHYHSTRLEHSINVSYTSYKLAKDLAGMLNQLPEADSYTICFTMIGEIPSLIKVMLGFTPESLSEMRRK